MECEIMGEYSDTEIHILGVLGHVMCLMQNHAKRLFSKFDLKPWQAGIVLVLAERDMSQKELAEQMNVTPSTITTSIQKMEREGYVKRCVDPKDQRVMRLSITEKSRQYLDDLSEVGNLLDDMIFAGMSVEERIVLRRLIVQVRDNLQQAEEQVKKSG